MAESRTGTTGSLRPAAGGPATEGPAATRALRLRVVSKTFPGVRALTAVDMDVASGSVHALVGHNGSGKSTLIKCLAGVYTPDPGAQAWLGDEALELGDPEDAERKGLRFVHQDLGIIQELSAMDNVGFVRGFERGAFGGISWRRQAQRTRELLAQFGFMLDPQRPLGEASPPERAAVAIVRAVAGWQAGRGVLVLDEPTAALPAHEVDRLFQLIREVSVTGTAVILVSHRLDEVMAIADSVTVLRDGAKVWEGPLAATSLQRLVDLIADTDGQARAEEARAEEARTKAARAEEVPAEPVAPAAPALEVRDLHGRYLRGISLTMRPGEVVGVAGLLGSGREELPYVVAGAAAKASPARWRSAARPRPNCRLSGPGPSGSCSSRPTAAPRASSPSSLRPRTCPWPRCPRSAGGARSRRQGSGGSAGPGSLRSTPIPPTARGRSPRSAAVASRKRCWPARCRPRRGCSSSPSPRPAWTSAPVPCSTPNCAAVPPKGWRC